MKKLFTTSLFIFLCFGFCKAQWVTIPDTAFISVLRGNGINCINGNQLDTTCPSLSHEVIMLIDNPNITDITGIQYFSGLTRLEVDGTNLSFLPKLPNTLQIADCYNNKIKFISKLPAGLTALICSYNNLDTLPTLPLNLQSLSCDSNHLTYLPTLPQGLQALTCANNPLYSLPHLPDGITTLNCYYDRLTSIPTLPKNLTNLNCQFNRLDALPPLPGTLTNLTCNNNNLTFLPTIPKALTELDCHSNQLTYIPNLPDSCFECTLDNNPNLYCLPEIKKARILYFENTGVQCLPDYGQVVASIPTVSGLPLCSIINETSCPIFWNIQGSVYFDKNNNCIYQDSERFVFPEKVKLLQNGNLLQQAYFSGNYDFKTNLAAYSVELDTSDLPFNVTCPTTGDDIAVNVTTFDSLISGINFGLQCKPGFDVGAWDIQRLRDPAHNFFPGDTPYVYISAGDVTAGLYGINCESGISGQVKVVINGPVSYLAPLYPALAPSINGDTLIYSIADFSLLNPYVDFAFSLTVDTEAKLGDQVCFNIYVTPTLADNNLSNNHLQYCFVISNSLDPNEKEVSPTGNLPFGFNDWLTYTIHFQNTGTAAAQNIQVLDTLSSNLDPETFQLLSYSVQPIVQITGRDVAFSFTNINLPDTAASKTSSIGYVEYRIKPITNLAGGATINNTASIYFDFNSPIVTNTTTNTIEVATGVKNIKPVSVSLYPNPVSGQLTVSSNQLNRSEIEISDLLGRNVFSQIASGNKTTIDVNYLTPGVYFLHIRSAGVDEVRKFVKE